MRAPAPRLLRAISGHLGRISHAGRPIPSRAKSAIRSSEVDGPSLRFVVSPRLNRRAHSRLVHGSGHIVRALGARAGRVDLSGRLIVGGCLLMHAGRAYRVRRKAGCGSGTGVRHGAGRRYLSPQPVTCRPRCRARKSYRPRASAYRAGHRELAHPADATRRAHWPAGPASQSSRLVHIETSAGSTAR